MDIGTHLLRAMATFDRVFSMSSFLITKKCSIAAVYALTVYIRGIVDEFNAF